MTTTYAFTYASGAQQFIEADGPPLSLEPVGGLWKIANRSGHIIIVNWHLVNYAEIITES